MFSSFTERERSDEVNSPLLTPLQPCLPSCLEHMHMLLALSIYLLPQGLCTVSFTQHMPPFLISFRPLLEKHLFRVLPSLVILFNSITLTRFYLTPLNFIHIISLHQTLSCLFVYYVFPPLDQRPINRRTLF